MSILNKTKKCEISVIIPIVERYDNLEKLFHEYSEPLRKIGKTFEFLFVVDGRFDNAYKELKHLRESHSEIKIIKFVRDFHESIALMAGIAHAEAPILFTLSAYFQVEPQVMVNLLEEIDKGNDLVITRRFPRKDNILNRMQSSLFNGLVKMMTGCRYKDIACGMRAMTKECATAMELIGDMHRFIPILAYQKGFKIVEVKAEQRIEDRKLRLFNPGVYVRRVIDIISLFFLTKFTRKPLRFFGLIGVNLLAVGAIISSYLAYIRIVYGDAIAGRPLLLLGLLLMVLGVQVASLGLLGELIIFTHAQEIKEYHIDEIIG